VSNSKLALLCDKRVAYATNPTKSLLLGCRKKCTIAFHGPLYYNGMTLITFPNLYTYTFWKFFKKMEFKRNLK